MIRNPIPWPNGAKCAVAITFDMDADSLIHIAKPGDSHDRLYPISMGRYGPMVALELKHWHKRLSISLIAVRLTLSRFTNLMELWRRRSKQLPHAFMVLKM